jgi:hypothetical protein
VARETSEYSGIVQLKAEKEEGKGGRSHPRNFSGLTENGWLGTLKTFDHFV